MNKNLQIEGLRAIGLIIVVLFHFLYWREKFLDDTRYSITFMKEWGLIGVGLFFIISGYFLFPVQTVHREISPKSWISSKIQNLWIPYALAIGIIWLFFRTGIIPGYMPSIKELFINLAGCHYLFDVRSIEGAHWYMIQLGTFLFLTFVIRFFNLRLIYILPCYFIICMAFQICRECIGYHPFILFLLGGFCHKWNLITLMLGICLKQYQCTSNNKIKSVYFSYIIILCCSLYFFNKLTWYTSTAATSIIVLYAIFILSTLKKIPFLEIQLLTFIGSISFYVYLIHQYIGYSIIHYLQPDVGNTIAVTVAIISSIIMGIFLKHIHNKIIKYLKHHKT